MPTSLRQRLNDLAASFASHVLDAIRGASIDDLVAQSSGAHTSARAAAARSSAPRPVGAPAAPRAARAARGRGGRLARRSAADIGGVVERIVGLLRQNPRGLRAEQIRHKLGLLPKEMPRPLKEAVAARRLGKSGQKRATTYFVKSGGAPPSPPAAKPNRPARKARRSARSARSVRKVRKK